MRRAPLVSLALSIGVIVFLVTGASAAPPGTWRPVLDLSVPGSTAALNGRVLAINTDRGPWLVGGSFTDAAGNPDADHIASYNGVWSPVGPGLNGDVRAIAIYGNRTFAGGTFTNAGGNANADFLAVWDGASWAPFCNSPNGPAFGGNVNALKVIGTTLYVGGSFQNGAGIASADYLLACNLDTGAVSSTVAADGQISGSVYALAADANGNLFAGGTFVDMASIPAADYVAYYDGVGWHPMGAGAGMSGGAVNGIVRAVATSGTSAYVGTDATDIAGIPQADHVARWSRSGWSALGSNTAGTDGWFPASTYIYGIATDGDQITVTGSFQNANGDPTADEIASFDGSVWGPLGSDGAGNGPLNAEGDAIVRFGDIVLVGGLFGNAGGQPEADSLAIYEPNNGPTSLPPPTEGKTVNAVPAAGTVLVKLPAGAGAKAGTGFVPLASIGRQLPVGSTLDTTKGVVRLAAATNSAGGTQEGRISKGRFTVLQAAKNPLTTLVMTGSALGACSKLPAGGAPKAGSAAAKRKRTLFANVQGRFRTRGRNSSATVRGTQYRMTDTCAGTLTRVTKGTVQIRDFTLRKNKTLRAGQSYFARAPKRR